MTKVGVRNVVLRQIETVDFRKNERTCWREFIAKHRNFVLRPDESLLLLSKSLNQLCFVYGTTKLDDVPGGLEILASVKFRISGGTWNPLRLKEYANEVGLELVGLKSFTQHYEASRLARAKHRNHA